MPKHRFDAVIFDLLTALLDSWTLWNDVAGKEEVGRKWREIGRATRRKFSSEEKIRFPLGALGVGHAPPASYIPPGVV